MELGVRYLVNFLVQFQGIQKWEIPDKGAFLSEICPFWKRQYEIKQAVGDISFTIEEGELVGLVGMNGAVSSVSPSQAGHILMAGERRGAVTIIKISDII